MHFTVIFAILFFSFSSSVLANKTVSITIANGIEAEFNIKQAKGNTLLLVIPSEHGLQEAETRLLKILPDYGIEVWLSNLLESYFLENTASNLERIPAQDIYVLLESIHKKTNKNIIILASGRSAIPILRAHASWPKKILPAYLSGLILMHPNLFKSTPEPGAIAELMPSVKNTNQLIYLIQPKLSPYWWNRDISLEGLQQSGSDVFIQTLKDIRNRFYFREDATAYEMRLREKYPNLIYNAITQINRYPKIQRNIAASYQANTAVTSVKKERSLSAYKGTPNPPALKLLTLEDNVLDLKNEKGKVVLVNFWASWCPPCVHEMPSMQQLDNYFHKKNKNAFKILAVNMAEDKKTINEFLSSKVSVDFDIMLDSNGAALKAWKVFAFPTSFIIGKKGKIRYAIYGGLDWFTPTIKNKIQTLIDE